MIPFRKFKNLCNHISTSSPIFTRNNPSTPIEDKKNQLFLYHAPTSIKKWITTFSNLSKSSCMFGGGKRNEEREKDEDRRREEIEGNVKRKVEFRKL